MCTRILMTTDITTQIIIVVATLLIALSMGLFLRYLLVRRLKKTVLDNWLIQILGFLIIIPPVIVGTIVASFFFGIQLPEMLAILQYVVKDILTIWNIQFGIPAAVISFITVGFTFVLQDLLKNIVAGIYILVEGPFHIGDVISTDVYSGRVEDVQLRATKLRIPSGEQVIVPNSMLFTGIVVNKTIYDEKRATIVITMPLDKYDKEQTVGCILKTIKGVTGVMIKPEPTLSLSSVAGAFGSSTGTVSGYTGEIISFTLRFWIPEGGDALVSEAMLALREALPYADLSIREPTGLL